MISSSNENPVWSTRLFAIRDTMSASSDTEALSQSMSSLTENTSTTIKDGETAEKMLERFEREEFEMRKWFTSYSHKHDCRKLEREVSVYLALEDGICRKVTRKIFLLALSFDSALEC